MNYTKTVNARIEKYLKWINDECPSDVGWCGTSIRGKDCKQQFAFYQEHPEVVQNYLNAQLKLHEGCNRKVMVKVQARTRKPVLNYEFNKVVKDKPLPVPVHVRKWLEDEGLMEMIFVNGKPPEVPDSNGKVPSDKEDPFLNGIKKWDQIVLKG